MEVVIGETQYIYLAFYPISIRRTTCPTNSSYNTLVVLCRTYYILYGLFIGHLARLFSQLEISYTWLMYENVIYKKITKFVGPPVLLIVIGQN